MSSNNKEKLEYVRKPKTILDFIEEARNEGYSDKEIKELLKEAGWPDDEIKKHIT